MTTNFPSSADSFTNPSASDELDDEVGARTHSEMHADLNDGMEAVQAYLLSGTGIEGWHYVGAAGEPAFENSWANLGFGQIRLAFRKVGNVVYLGGTIWQGGGAFTVSTIFTLPVGYRPSAAALAPAIATDFAGATLFAAATISTAGAVAPSINPGAGTYPVYGFVGGLWGFVLDPPTA